MNKVFSNNQFFFNKIYFKKEHYTDNRQGAFCHYLARLEKGRCRIAAKDKTLEISEGDVFYIPMGLSYQSYWSSSDEIVFNSLGFVTFPEGENQNFGLQKIECSNEIKELIENIPTGKITSRALGEFYTLFSKILPLMTKSCMSKAESVYYKALDYMYQNPQCSIDELASVLHICQSSIYTAFKKASGKTPNAAKRELLCEKAIMLLSTTDKSVQEISDLLGFSSTSYFRKTLKTATSSTPRDIRKKRVF